MRALLRTGTVIGLVAGVALAGFPGSALAAPTVDCAAGVPGLTVASLRTGPARVGKTVHRSFLVTNRGATRLRQVTVDADLAGVLDDGSLIGRAKAEQGSVRVRAGVLHWRGDLAPGATVDVTYKVRVGKLGDGKLTEEFTTDSASCTAVKAVPNPKPVATPSAAPTATGKLPRFQRPNATTASVETFPSGLTATIGTTNNGTTGGVAVATNTGTATAGGSYSPTGVWDDGQANQLNFTLNNAARNTYQNIGGYSVTLSRPVRNPRMQIRGWYGAIGSSDYDTFAPKISLTGGLPAAPTMTRVSGFTNWTVGATQAVINSTPVDYGGTNGACDTTGSTRPGTDPAGCGTIELTGTITRANFNVDIIRTPVASGNTSTGYAGNGSIKFTVDEDCSNAPSPYGAASHVVSDAFLGADTTADLPATGSTTACLNEADANDANPAFGALSTTSGGSAYTVNVPVKGGSGATTLAGFIDFNRDLDFADAGEAATAAVSAGATGTVPLTWTVPAGANISAGNTWARFRIGYNATQTNLPTGMADSGEVEDYPLQITAPPNVCGYTPVNLANGSFESPVIAVASTQLPEDTVPGWETTATDNFIELWRSPPNATPPAPGQGAQFAELNAFQVSTLYQDVATVPGAPMTWSLWHRGRQGTDVMKVQIGPPAGPLVDQTPTGASGPNISDGNTAWGQHRGSYIIPAGQTTTRFAFVSVSATGGNPALGNLLDGIAFGTPGCLTATKTVAPTTPAQPGDTLTYTVSVTNPGASETLNSFITDVVPAGTTFVPGSIKMINPAAVTTAVTDANGISGTNLKVAIGDPLTPTGGGNVKVGEVWKVTFQVTVNAGLAAGSSITNQARGQWVPYGVQPPLNSTPAVATVAVAAADLQTTKTALNPVPVAPGTTFDYQIAVTNNGPALAKNVSTTDTLPTPFSFVSSVDGCTAVGQVVSCGPLATLAAAASKTWRFTVRLDAAYSGDGSDLGNIAVARSDTADPSPSNNANPSAKPSGPVTGKADLVMAKRAVNAAPVTPGGTFDYQVTITNNGPSVARNVKAVDPLPTALSFVSSVDGCTAAGQTVTCGPQATLDFGAAKTWTFTVRLDAGYTGDGSDLGNIAVAQSDTADPSPSNNANPSAKPSGAIGSPKADLVTAKTALNTAPVTPGTTFDYQITITNNGPSTAAAVKATDPLPTALAFVSSVDGCTAAGQTVTCGPVATLAAGAAKVWRFTVRLDAGYTGDGSDLGNVAVASSTTADPSPSNNTNASAKPSGGVTSPSADLVTAKKALNSTPVTPGTPFSYQITVTNNGPSVAAAVKATDPLPTPLTFVSSADGCTAAGQTVTCGPQATLAVGASKSWTFVVKLDAGYTGDGSDLGNVAVVSSTTADPSPSNNANPSAKPSGAVGSPSADLVMAKRALNAAPVTPGTTFSYQLTITNNGPSTAAGVKATDALPTPLTFVSSADGCTAAGQTVTCGPQATLAVGASKSWTFVVKLDAGYTGDGSDLGNVAVAGSTTADPSPSNNANPSAKPSGAVASPSADLVMAKQALNAAPVTPGTTFSYQVTITNNGPSTAVAVKATDPLPTPLTFVSSVDGCTAAGQTVTCGPQATLAVGASKSWTFVVKLDAGYTGDGSDLGNIAVASSTTADPSPSNNANPSAKPSGAIALPSADLVTAKQALNTAPVTPGTTFSYQITVTNNGPSVARTVRATDPLPTPLTFVSSIDGCTAAGQTVTCGPIATLAVGASKVWTFVVKLDAGYTGDGSDLGNVAVGQSDTPDPSPSNNANPSAKPSGAVASPSADLVMAKQALNTAPVTPGTTFSYQVTITNNGPSTAVAVKATDPLPTPLTFVSSADGCTAAGQTVTCGPQATLAVGASKSWTFVVKLDAGYPGDGSDLGNIAVAGSTTADPSPSNNANPSAKPSGAIASAAADLVTAKVALNTAPVVPGTTFDYRITVTNNGPSVAAAVRATDPLPTALTFVSSADGCTAAGQVVSCGPVATLAVGASTSWTFTVQLDAGYTGDGSDLGNVAVAGSTTADPSPSNNANPSAKPSGGVASPSADLATGKVALNSAPVTPGTTFDYQITVTNNGPSQAVGVTATDSLPLPLTFETSADGCLATGQLVTCGPPMTLAVGAAKSWTFTVRLDAGYTGDGSDLGNIAVAGSDTADPSPSNNANPSPGVGPSGGVASPSADLATAKVALNSAPVTPGTTFDYQITVTNSGPSSAVNAKAADPLPTALTFVSSADGCTAAGQTVTCGPEALLANGASRSWTFTVRLDAGYTGDGSDLGNIAVAGSDTADPSPSNNGNPSPGVGPSGGVASPSADLATTKVALNSGPVTPGTTFDYQVTVTNNGPSAASAVTATDPLPTPLAFVSSVDGCTAAGQTVSCGPVATLAVGASTSWTFTVKLDAGYTGDGSDLGNVAVGDADTADPSPSNNANPSAMPSGGVASPSADLVTDKVALNSAPVTPGTTFDYQITVTNNGPSTALNAKATDPLPTPLLFVSSVDGCTAAGQTVTCGPEAALGSGMAKSWIFTVRLDAGYTGDGSDLGNIAVAGSDTADPSPSNNGNPSPGVGPSGGVASPSADLATAKVALNSVPVTPGTTFDYQITVTNNGPSTAVNAKATDPLPTALTFVSSADGCTAAGQTVTCGPEATLANGASVSWTFTVRLDAGYTGDGSDLGNIAVAGSDTADPSPSNNGNPSPGVGPSGGVASPSADLATAKIALDGAPVTPGTTFDYQITVTNNGPSAAVNAKATDPLPTPLTFVSSVDGCTAVGQTVTCGPEATLANGASVSWTFTVKLDAGYTGDGSDLGNIAVAGSDTADPSPSNDSNPSPGVGPSAGVASPSADLTTAKVALNPILVTPGTTFAYRVTVTNNGPSTAVNVKATDPLPTPLTFIASPDGCTAAGQTVTCGPEATLASGAAKSWTFIVKLDAGYTGDGSDLGNVAAAGSDTADPSPSDNANLPAPPSPGPLGGGAASPSADLSTAKVALNAAPVTPGTTFDYQITVTNNGPSVAVNARATDPLPTELTFVSSADGCTAAGQVVTCGPTIILAPGADTSWTFTVRLDAGYTGDGSDLGNIAVAGSDTADPSPSNNGNPSPGVGPSGGVASGSADLATAKVALNTAPVTPGTTFDYRVTVTNNGPSTAVNAKATDPLPTALTFVSSADGCTAAGQTVSCGPEATLANGASKSWTFTVRLDAGYTGDGSDLGNIAVVGSDTADPSPSNNSNPSPGAGPSSGVASPSADLATTKVALNSGPVSPGMTFDYQVTVTNNGPSTAVNAKAVDPLPTALTFVSSVDGCTAAGQTVTCGPEATLANAASRSWTFTVRLDDGYTGDGSDLGNIAVAGSDTADPSPSNNSNPSPGVGPSGPIGKPLTDLSTEKVALNSAPVTPGTTFDYRVTVSNNGPAEASNATATDPLPTPLLFVSSVDGCTASGQTVTCGPEPTLANGASKSWTFTVRLDAGYTGDGSDLGNIAVAGSDNPDPSPSNNGNPSPAYPSSGPSDRGVASPSADLATDKVALNTAPVVPGTTFDYRITVTNSGPSTAVNAKAVDPLPTALTFVSSADGCTAAGQTVTCGPQATLRPGVAKAWRFTVRLDAGYTGDGSDLGNIAVAGSDTADPSPSNNSNPSPGAGPSAGTAAPLADLQITLRAVLPSGGLRPGGSFDYVMSIRNNGPSVARDIVVTNVLPSAVQFVSSPQGCTASGQDVTCPTIDSMSVASGQSVVSLGGRGAAARTMVIELAASSSAQFTLRSRLDSGYQGEGSDLIDVARVSTATAETTLVNNVDRVPLVVASEDIPVTGSRVDERLIALVGATVVLMGTLIVWFTRRRRTADPIV
ncbi:putative repeat protein (TIGR01451 family) [Allocatelliglobosispora scoriae]|uniref:Putative repeat protein (TIGR01451 family) n=1 Tax=Allocatelliglobosispora scoriae TaxID=643052 RepID=A0A841BXI7_9ACTN|nr:isopeptide-forming domain-containing fimbrial protein [Allocatelliglobosispora scoriae]MBB5871859.1 putative repeat protein (TIGR01451 family) [Allocatelliglobosispora scoriae]